MLDFGLSAKQINDKKKNTPLTPSSALLSTSLKRGILNQNIQLYNFLKEFSSIKSVKTIAANASTIGTARGTTQGS